MKKYTFDEICESQDFEHTQEFVLVSDIPDQKNLEMGWKEWHGDYEKHTYIVKDAKGMLHECYPNDSKMHSFTTEIQFTVTDKIFVWAVL